MGSRRGPGIIIKVGVIKGETADCERERERERDWWKHCETADRLREREKREREVAAIPARRSNSSQL